MTLFEFDLLENDDDKLAETLLGGEYIACREVDGYGYMLYQLDAFYVEVWANNIDMESFKIRAFSSTTELAPYLQEIDISELIC